MAWSIFSAIIIQNNGMPKFENTVLFVVHEETAQGWVRRDPWYQITQKNVDDAKRLLARLDKAKPSYHRVIQFEFGPLEPLVPSTSRFTWKQVIDDIGENNVDIAGLRRTECVAIVQRELSALSKHRVSIKRRLTID